MDPRSLWRAAEMICRGEFAHNKAPLSRNVEGNIAQNDAKNVDIVMSHLENVYNIKHPVRLKYTKETMKQFETEHRHNKDISFVIFNECLGESFNDKAGGKIALFPKSVKPLTNTTDSRATSSPTNRLLGA